MSVAKRRRVEKERDDETVFDQFDSNSDDGEEHHISLEPPAVPRINREAAEDSSSSSTSSASQTPSAVRNAFRPPSEEDIESVRNGVVRDRISENVQIERAPNGHVVAIAAENDVGVRIRQLESALRVTPLSRKEIRTRLTAELARLKLEARASLDPPVPAAPAPGPAVPGVVAAAPMPMARGECGMCRELFALRFELEQYQANDADKQAASGQKKQSKRNVDARLANGEAVSSQYAKIFQFEALMRGQMHDSELIDHLLYMHRELIEKPSARFGIQRQPWTAAMLAEHFAVGNEHTFDKVREVRADLSSTRRVIEQVETRILVPDPGNPAVRSVDYRAVAAYEKLVRLKQLHVDTLEKYQMQLANTISQETAFALASALRGALLKEAITTDPRVSAGTMERGGDALRTAGKVVNGTQADFYTLSNY